MLKYPPFPFRQYRSIREYCIELLQRVDTKATPLDGRPLGYDYEVIRDKVLSKFPRVLYKGPHFGKKTRLSFKKIFDIVRDLNRDGVRLPLRPYRKKKHHQ